VVHRLRASPLREGGFYADTGGKPTWRGFPLVLPPFNIVPQKRAPFYDWLSLPLPMVNGNNMVDSGEDVYDGHTRSFALNALTGIGIDAAPVADGGVQPSEYVGDAERGLTIVIWWAPGPPFLFAPGDPDAISMGFQALFAMSKRADSIADGFEAQSTTFRLIYDQWAPASFMTPGELPTPMLRPEVVQCCTPLGELRTADYADSSAGRKTRDRPTTDMFEPRKPNGGGAAFAQRTWQSPHHPQRCTTARNNKAPCPSP
jgi:hypothetical protein